VLYKINYVLTHVTTTRKAKKILHSTFSFRHFYMFTQ